MKDIWEKLMDLAGGIATLICGVVFFPHFSNPDLVQSKLSTAGLTSFLIIICYLAILFLAKAVKRKRPRIRILFTLGIASAMAFLVLLFSLYYPFLNSKTLSLKHDCGGVILRGDTVNHAKLDAIVGVNYDSLSEKDPAEFVLNADCNASLAWTFQSIQHNFTILITYYCLLVALGCLAIFSLIKATHK